MVGTRKKVRDDHHASSFIDELDVFEEILTYQDEGGNSYYGSFLLLIKGWSA